MHVTGGSRSGWGSTRPDTGSAFQTSASTTIRSVIPLSQVHVQCFEPAPCSCSIPGRIIASQISSVYHIPEPGIAVDTSHTSQYIRQKGVWLLHLVADNEVLGVSKGGEHAGNRGQVIGIDYGLLSPHETCQSLLRTPAHSPLVCALS